MTIAFDAPAFTTAPRRNVQTDARFAATFLGLMGTVTAPLRRITDARLATVAGTVVDAWDQGRTIWLRLRTADGATGLISLDMARALAIPAGLYAVGSHVETAASLTLTATSKRRSSRCARWPAAPDYFRAVERAADPPRCASTCWNTVPPPAWSVAEGVIVHNSVVT